MLYWIASGLGLVAVLGVLGGLWKLNTRGQTTRVEATLPVDFPDAGFSHTAFEHLLARFVDARGAVDYAAWHQDARALAQLDRYLAALAAYSPDSDPDRFEHEGDVLGYWIYAYNAFVIKAVLDRWPLESVMDVKAPVEVVAGLGFFYTLRFVAGGQEYSLYDLEHTRVIGPAQDPRVHFVLNCASGSCPALGPRLPTGAELEPYLAARAVAFVSDPANVQLDAAAKTLTLSPIFEMYRDEFINDLRRRGQRSATILDYVRSVAPAELAQRLDGARDYTVQYRVFDWQVNRSRAQ